MLLTAWLWWSIAAMALVIDRRSFLTAGLIYLALVIGWAIRAKTVAVLAIGWQSS